LSAAPITEYRRWQAAAVVVMAVANKAAAVVVALTAVVAAGSGVAFAATACRRGSRPHQKRATYMLWRQRVPHSAAGGR